MWRLDHLICNQTDAKMAIKENLPISAITAVSKKVSNVFFLIWTILASCFNTPLPPNIQGKFKLEHHHGPNRQSNHAIWQRMLTYFLRVSITVWLTSCFISLDLAAYVVWNTNLICLVKSEPVKREVIWTVILPLMK